ncbi:MAG: polysaccharide biosynthesis protein [Bacteroidales bacterium]|nr:polysaccharide biosynthesis protein [Lachnoclostridium sp.]MCM1383335.1 polysaccharide biosynthesis protein [Lachnoclostridium sp.]MCM1464999.1 polysaccharide biosynthesis protein [Bacteroidales bacterium]
MASSNSSKNNFIMQAGILAMAGIITRIIGLLYRSPLHSVIGDLGMGYYQSAYTYYTMVLLISSYSIPSAISKVIAQKLGVKEYKNAHRIFKCSLAYVLVVGGVASLFLFFGAGLFVEETAVPVLRTLAPTIFLYGILGVLRGYFQAHKSMVQTSMSQILEQIANAVVSVAGAYVLIHSAVGAAQNAQNVVQTTQNVVQNSAWDVTRAVNGAVGSALGTGAGVLIALLFMLGIYRLNSNLIHGRIKRDQHRNVDSYKTIIRMITSVVTPFILSTAIYNLSSSVNTKIYTDFYPRLKELDMVEITARWGVFSAQALTISNIPIAFASAMASAMIPSVGQLIAAGDVDGTRQKIGVGVKTTMLISIPCGVGLFVLGKPVTGLIFPSAGGESLELAGKALMALALSVAFYALSTLNSSILQGLGKVNTPIVNAGIALAIQTAVGWGLLVYTNLDVYAIAIANTLYSGIMCILNQAAVRRAVGYRQELKKTFLIPALASLFMGVAAWAAYEGLYLLTQSMKISVIPAVLIAVVVYFVMLIAMRGVTEEELLEMPKGYLLVKIAVKCRLMRR